MSFFKKKDENSKTIRPKLRPANFNPSDSGSDPQEKSGTSGKGGGEATPTYDTSAPDWNKQVAKFNKKGGINNDGRFGYGYVDTQTGIEVPWYIDMINGGGANAAGDTFVSPFEGSMFGLPAQAVTGGLNALNVAPYGSNRPRYFMPMEAARVDAEGKPVQVDLGAAPRPTGGSPTSSPNLMNIPNSMTDDDMGLPTGPVPPTSAQPMSSFLTRYPSRMSPEQYDLVYNDPVAPQVLAGADGGIADLARLNRNRSLAMGSQNTQAPDIDPAMVGNDPSLSKARLRKDLIKTMPPIFANSETDQMYRYYLQSGGTMPFSRWAKGER